MKKYAKLDSDGYVVMLIDASIEQPECTVVDFEIPPAIEGYKFHFERRQWEDCRTSETQWPIVRAKRNQLLIESDWTQLPDVLLETKAEWALYRQALRDVTNQSDPFNIVWPVAP